MEIILTVTAFNRVQSRLNCYSIAFFYSKCSDERSICQFHEFRTLQLRYTMLLSRSRITLISFVLCKKVPLSYSQELLRCCRERRVRVSRNISCLFFQGSVVTLQSSLLPTSIHITHLIYHYHFYCNTTLNGSQALHWVNFSKKTQRGLLLCV